MPNKKTNKNTNKNTEDLDELLKDNGFQIIESTTKDGVNLKGNGLEKEANKKNRGTGLIGKSVSPESMYSYKNIKRRLRDAIELNKKINGLIAPYLLSGDDPKDDFFAKISDLAAPQRTEFELKKDLDKKNSNPQLICKQIITLSNLCGIYEDEYQMNFDLFRQNIKNNFIEKLEIHSSYIEITESHKKQVKLEREVNQLYDDINESKENYLNDININFYKRVKSIPDFDKAENIVKSDFLFRWNEFVQTFKGDADLPFLSLNDLGIKKNYFLENLKEKKSNNHSEEEGFFQGYQNDEYQNENESKAKLDTIKDYYSTFKVKWDRAVESLPLKIKELKKKEDELVQLNIELNEFKKLREEKLRLAGKEILESNTAIDVLDIGIINTQFFYLKIGSLGHYLLDMLWKQILPEVSAIFEGAIKGISELKPHKNKPFMKFNFANKFIMENKKYYELLHGYLLSETVRYLYNQVVQLKKLNARTEKTTSTFLSDALFDEIVFSSPAFLVKIRNIFPKPEVSFTWIDKLVDCSNSQNKKINFAYSEAMAADNKFARMNTVTFKEFERMQKLDEEIKAENDSIELIFNKYRTSIKWLKFLRASFEGYTYEVEYRVIIEKLKSSLPDDFCKELEYMMRIAELKMTKKNKEGDTKGDDSLKVKKKLKKEEFKEGCLLIGSLSRIIEHKAILAGKKMHGLLTEDEYLMTMTRLGNTTEMDVEYNDFHDYAIGGYNNNDCNQFDAYANEQEEEQKENIYRGKEIEVSTLIKTQGEGNCLIHALAGIKNTETNMIECNDHLNVRLSLVKYVIDNIDQLTKCGSNDKKDYIAITMLTHFLNTAVMRPGSSECKYWVENKNIFTPYQNELENFDYLIDDAITNENHVIEFYKIINSNEELLRLLVHAIIVRKENEEDVTQEFEKRRLEVLDQANKGSTLKHLMKTNGYRAKIGSCGNELTELIKSIDESEKKLIKNVKDPIACVLNYYAGDGIWLTNEFAEIYAMMKELNVIVYTGQFQEDGKGERLEYLYSKNNKDINIGIRNGELGNHFEQINDLESWLGKKGEKQSEISNKFNKDYALIESAAEKIVKLFLEKEYELKTPQEKQDFCELIEKEGEEMFMIILQSLYENEFELPLYIWEGIAATLFVELMNRPVGFILPKLISSSIADFSAIALSGINEDVTIPAFELINNFANRLNSFSHEELDDFIEKNKSKIFGAIPDEVTSSKAFALQYGIGLVVKKYLKVFIDDLEGKFCEAFYQLNHTGSDTEEDEIRSKYAVARKMWMFGTYSIKNEANELVKYSPPNFDEWKNEMTHVLLFSVPLFIIESIPNGNLIVQNQKIKSAQKTIKNLNLDKLDLGQFALLLSYSLQKEDEVKDFMKERINKQILDKEEQEIFQFKATSISELIYKKAISSVDLARSFMANYWSRDKIKECENIILQFSYKIKRPDQMEAVEYTGDEKDMMIPSRKNNNRTQVIFTKEVKKQINSDTIPLDFWKKIADNGFVGGQGSQGIKILTHEGKRKIYELKSLGISGVKRCYAIMINNILFVVGLEDQKGQQQNHIKKYEGYEIAIIPAKK